MTFLPLDAIRAIRRSPLPPSAKLLAVMLVSRADARGDIGVARVGLSQLAEDTGLGRRTVQRALEDFEKLPEGAPLTIQRESGHYRGPSNTYRIAVANHSRPEATMALEDGSDESEQTEAQGPPWPLPEATMALGPAPTEQQAPEATMALAKGHHDTPLGPPWPLPEATMALSPASPCQEILPSPAKREKNQRMRGKPRSTDSKTPGLQKETGTKPSSRGHRLPADWLPDEELVRYATDRNGGCRFNPDTLVRIVEDFRCYWLAKPGANATKLDWSLTFQGWLRRERDKHPEWPDSANEPPEPKRNPKPPGYDERKRAEAEAAARAKPGTNLSLDDALAKAAARMSVNNVGTSP